MIKRQREADGFTLVETDDPTYVLKDREKARVRLSLRDAKDYPRSELEEHLRRHSLRDARRFGLADPFALNKPGFRFCTDAKQLAAIDEAYAAYNYEQTNAWRGPTADNTQPFIGQRSGDPCTINGRAGHLRDVKGKLVCVPNNHADARSMMDAREAAYRLTDWEAENAWRGKDWLDNNRPQFTRGRLSRSAA